MDGKTLVYGIIGDSVSHSFSPKIHTFFAEHFGINMAYLPFNVKPGELREAIYGAHALGIKGFNVTVPHKQAVMPYLASINPQAQKIGAVNTLVWGEEGYNGHNTDYLGIRRILRECGSANANVLVIGAGGSAYAACIAAAEENAASITIINRTLENAISLATHVNKYYNVRVNTQMLEKYSAQEFSLAPDIIIQTTTVGFGDLAAESPVADSVFENARLAFDILYSPWETVFLRQAAKAGVPHIVNGFPMLVEQAAAAFSIWHPVEYDGYEHIETLQKLCLGQ